MRETKADCTIYSPDGSGCNGYTAQLYSGQKLKWLDENDVETLIGSRGLKKFMDGHSDFRVSLAKFNEMHVEQAMRRPLNKRGSA